MHQCRTMLVFLFEGFPPFAIAAGCVFPAEVFHFDAFKVIKDFFS